MDLTQLKQFHIINYFKVDLSLIIYYLIYLIYLVNILNQNFELTYVINHFNQLVIP